MPRCPANNRGLAGVRDRKLRVWEKRRDPLKKSDLFIANMKKPVSSFELKSSYLDLIDRAERELCIMMAYFAPDKEILSAKKCALHRDVHVRILIPRSANYMDDMNKLTVSKLIEYSGEHSGEYGGRLEVFMTEKCCTPSSL